MEGVYKLEASAATTLSPVTVLSNGGGGAGAGIGPEGPKVEVLSDCYDDHGAVSGSVGVGVGVVAGGGPPDAYGLTSYYDGAGTGGGGGVAPPASSTKKEDFEERPPCIFTPPQQMTPDALYSGTHHQQHHQHHHHQQHNHHGHHNGSGHGHHHHQQQQHHQQQHHHQQQQQHYTQLSSSSSGEPSPPPGSVGVGGVSASGLSSGHSPPLGMTVLYDHNKTGSAADCNGNGSSGNGGSVVSGHGGTKSSQSKASKADQSFAAADSNSGNTPSKAFVPCKVCGDKASGYHYGVTSCEGCKGFFRRSIQKQIEYRCLRDGKCLVIRLNRNRCQYCRFKKCIAVGMSRDSVRYGRVPKRSRERNDEARVTQSEADQSARDMENKQLAIYDIILTISQAHHANCAYTEERTRGLARKPAVFNMDEIKMEPDLVTGSMDSGAATTTTTSDTTTDQLEQQKFFMWQQFATYVTPSIQRVVEFAKRTPGFSDLSQDDQLILIKSSFFEVWLVHVSRLVSPLDNTLTFSDGSYVDRHNLDIVFDPEFVTALFTFAVTFNNLQLSDTEIGIFSAVVLLTSDRPGISDHKFIEQQQEKLVEALKLQVARHHAGDAHFLPNVILKLGELRALGVKHLEHLQWFRLHWDRLKLPPLFAEIFDIPKGDEDFIQIRNGAKVVLRDALHSGSNIKWQCSNVEKVMSVPAFTDITVEEQTSAIRWYLNNLNAPIAEENSDDGFEWDLHHIISCCDVCFDKGTEAETESVFNSIVSLLVTVPPERCENLVVSFCEKLAKAPNNKLALVSLRVLSNLFQGLDDCCLLRFNVYYYMVKVAGITGSVLAVFTDVDKMKRWMKQCDVSTDKLQRILRLLHEILLASKQSELASKVMVELLSTYTEDNASQARDEAHRCIVASLGDPSTFLLDHLLTLKPVKFLEGELIHDLLTIFVSEKLSAYINFYNANKEFIDSLGLRHAQNMQKMMLLTFMQIAELRKEIPYEVLQLELQIGADAVEMFVIDALRTKMIQAKVDQLNRRVVVSSTIHRTFGKPQWQLLREVLAQWKASVAHVDENMENVLGVPFTVQAPNTTTAAVAKV